MNNNTHSPFNNNAKTSRHITQLINTDILIYILRAYTSRYIVDDTDELHDDFFMNNNKW